MLDLPKIEITNNRMLRKLLNIDIKSGIYDKVQAIAEKLKIFDRSNRNKSDLDYYIDAAKEYLNEQERRVKELAKHFTNLKD